MASLKSAALLALFPFFLMSIAEACSGSPDGDGGPDGSTYDAEIDAGTLYLSELSVTDTSSGESSSGSMMIPRFSPVIFDYYVRCLSPEAGQNQINVSMKASKGAQSYLTSPTHSASANEQTLSVEVSENQAIVAVASDGSRTVEYWVRCLPPDFPVIEWEPHPEAGSRTPGYYLLGTAVPPSPTATFAFILDDHGVPVWYIRGSGGIIDVDDLVDGSVSLFSRDQPLPHKFELRHIHPLSTSYAFAGQQTDEHELRYLPDSGHFISFATPVQAGVDLTGMKVPLPDGGFQVLKGDQAIIDCNIQEFTSDGKRVWSWRALEHFDPVKDSTWPQFQDLGPDGGPAINPFHCNSIDVDPATGNLLVSSRHMDSVFYIDKASGKVIWKMGGNRFTKDDATYIDVDASPFFRQHDARLQPGWSETCTGGGGQISLFDDETAAGPRARGVIYDVIVGTGAGDGGTAHCPGGVVGGKPGTATVKWEYYGRTNSSETGSVRVQPDGTRVIGWGGNTYSRAFSEVDEKKNDLLDVTFGVSGETYRAIKVPLSAYDIAFLRQTAGLP